MPWANSCVLAEIFFIPSLLLHGNTKELDDFEIVCCCFFRGKYGKIAQSTYDNSFFITRFDLMFNI